MNTPLNSSPPSWTKGLSQDDLNAMHRKLIYFFFHVYFSLFYIT